MTRASDLKKGIRIARKLDSRKPLTIAELRVLKSRGLIKKSTKKGIRIERTKEGDKFVRRIKALGLI